VRAWVGERVRGRGGWDCVRAWVGERVSGWGEWGREWVG